METGHDGDDVNDDNDEDAEDKDDDNDESNDDDDDYDEYDDHPESCSTRRSPLVRHALRKLRMRDPSIKDPQLRRQHYHVPATLAMMPIPPTYAQTSTTKRRKSRPLKP